MADFSTPQLDALKEKLPDSVKDVKINLGNVLGSESLTRDQVWGIAYSSACYLRLPRLRDAIQADARSSGVGEPVFEDAQAAAALMGMNTIFYRFRHMIGKPSYSQRPARLRMQWMTRPKTTKTDYEVFCLAIAALEGCEACVKAHEDAVLKAGLNEDQVVDILRIAAVINGFAVALALT